MRSPDPGDRRSVVVELTAAGRPTARRVRRSVAALERRIAAACSPGDLAAFRRVLDYVTSSASPNE